MCNVGMVYGSHVVLDVDIMEKLTQDTNLGMDYNEYVSMMSTPMAFEDTSHYENVIGNHDDIARGGG